MVTELTFQVKHDFKNLPTTINGVAYLHFASTLVAALVHVWVLCVQQIVWVWTWVWTHA